VLKETKHYLIAQGRNPGSPSIEYWLYSPTGSGITSVALKYSRSWSKEHPVRTFQVNIAVS
jgi:predicted secreted protein